MKPRCAGDVGGRVGRLPPGRRGLKRAGAPRSARRVGSPSPRKAWIETGAPALTTRCIAGRLPPGRRGLKQRRSAEIIAFGGRLPPGRRGLKLCDRCIYPAGGASPSPRKAWIETRDLVLTGNWLLCRLPPGRRGLKPSGGRSPTAACCRLPPGRRGLKQLRELIYKLQCRRLPPGRRGLKPFCVGFWFTSTGRRLPPGRRGLKPAARADGLRNGLVAFPPEGVD